MLFNSWGYLAFLLIAVPVHWLLPHGRLRVAWLAALSVLFYAMWRWEFSLLVIFSAGVDYVASLKIGATEDHRIRKRWLLVSLVLNLGLLFFFKYTYFVVDNVRLVGSWAGFDLPALQDLGIKIILPLGISFYTFQTISYTIDVYRRVTEPTRDFLLFLTYVTFWPQLIAGPVLRASEVMPQLAARRRIKLDDFGAGLALIVIGLFQKVALADSLSPLVDEAFAKDAGALTALDVWVASFLFGFQIYFDFAGYSSIALGSGRLVGMVFPKNFDFPYVAAGSPREFWRRWHISLSAWIRDYVYLPLTGQRFRTESSGGIAVATSAGSRTSALILTWFLMGLWHGAAWTFALWGLYHAALILAYRQIPLLRDLPERAPWVARILMLFLGMAGWIAFRAESMGQALAMFGSLLNPFAYRLAGRGLDVYSYFWAGAMTVGVAGTWIVVHRHARKPFRPVVFLPVMTVSMALMVCAVLTCMRQVKQFIYFQF